MEIQMWKEILNPYELAVEELQVKFKNTDRQAYILQLNRF